MADPLSPAAPQDDGWRDFFSDLENETFLPLIPMTPQDVRRISAQSLEMFSGVAPLESLQGRLVQGFPCQCRLAARLFQDLAVQSFPFFRVAHADLQAAHQERP
jgi:hypothetical protein